MEAFNTHHIKIAKKKTASTMLSKFAQFQANVFNDIGSFLWKVYMSAYAK
jgi:hypothetical protein